MVPLIFGNPQSKRGQDIHDAKDHDCKWVSTHRATGVATHGKRHNAVLLATDLSHSPKVNNQGKVENEKASISSYLM